MLEKTCSNGSKGIGTFYESAAKVDIHLTFTVPLDRDGRVFARYRVNALPSTFFVDRSGIIRDVMIGGPMARTFIESQITTMLVAGEE